ncbi:MAG TPA: DUF2695 domain-containing protein [Gemmataceae bacterium]|nr:DUF2695 domain-containing protein [Gemmataceae bacterium]
MTKTVSELEVILLEGQRRSKQGSYMRRKPAAEALPFLIEARTGLQELVRINDKDPQAWRLLAQAEECLLNYAAARRCLETAMSLSARKDKKDLKRLALLRENEKQWAELELNPDQLGDLGEHLQAALGEAGCDHTFRFTEEWLRRNNGNDINRLLETLRGRGGYCDCEVLANVIAE